MDPVIRYATTRDRVGIAYWAEGNGPAFVCPPPALPWSHLQLEMEIPEWRHWYEHLLRGLRVVRYDNRGAGLSDREVDEVNFETHIADLEAVVDAAGLEKFALFGLFYNSAVVLQYAARHPEKVSHIILWCGVARSSDSKRPPAVQDAFERLMDVDWELFTENVAHTVFGWSEGERAHRFAEYLRASSTPAIARASWRANSDFDLRELLPSITAPTLVIHRRQFPLVDVAVARDIANRMPNARLEVIDGSAIAPYVGDMAGPLRAIDEFLGLSGAMIDETEHQRTGVSGGFRTIMFTDMEGSTAATQRMGDAQAQEMVRTHNRIVRDALHAFDGTEVKHTGDGIMASFTSAVLSLECAISIQRRLAMHRAMNPDHPSFDVRIGINAGEPVIDGNDLFGTAVQLASRVCNRAEAQQILVSDVVRQLVAGKGFLFADRGDTELRGFEEPVRLYELRWREAD